MSLYNLEETAKSCPTAVTNTRSTYKNARLTALESRSFCFSDQHILHRQQQNKLFCTAVPMWLGSAISPSKRLFYPLQSSALELSTEPTSSCNTFAILLKKWHQPFFILMHLKNIGQHQLLAPCPKPPMMPLNEQNKYSRALASPVGLGQAVKLFNGLFHKHHPGNCCTTNIQTSILFGRTTDFPCISPQFSSSRATFSWVNSDKFERTQENQQKLSIHGDT